MLANKTFNYLLVFISALLYLYFAYFLNRSDFYLLLGLYSVLFLILTNLLKNADLNFKQLTYISIVFYALFLFSTPNLSQDFYRFIWDGRMLANGISPYLFTPNEILKQNPEIIPQAQDLVNGMQNLNASHYSNYPPVSQWIYVLAAAIAPKSILGATIVMRIILILANVGILYFGKKILGHLNLPLNNIFWFSLNPLIILELVGNLHYEGLMLLFLLAAIYFILKQKTRIAALFFGLSVATKLLPLVLLPIFYRFFSQNHKPTSIFRNKNLLQFIQFTALSIFVFILSFWGLIEEHFFKNFSSSIALWFGTFEFNASFYYLFRWIGFQLVGWNTIATLSKIGSVSIFIYILYLAFLKKTSSQKAIFQLLLFGVSFYFLFSTTVHPWYIATPLLLSVFTRFKFLIVWSFTVILSYAAYQNEIYTEKIGLIALEYTLVLGYLIYDLLCLKKKKSVFLK
ncbi:polyprenol phosphomannose-dependent alpha 1,6 mannosyltransferase MptB [Psychroflexus salis]|uniref:polyprenol phosphomannose-dependent alpha 1,6 mannosyltransferase MptB n=1 Tax=Psychroflexus salis TaxID=1526574 RepID=UPI001665B66F|nr:polyprenol phosphomannose-dependent alpha 1,6 mannosyltransferase MptB [Psychroflexus salis]